MHQIPDLVAMRRIRRHFRHFTQRPYLGAEERGCAEVVKIQGVLAAEVAAKVALAAKPAGGAGHSVQVWVRLVDGRADDRWIAGIVRVRLAAKTHGERDGSQLAGHGSPSLLEGYPLWLPRVPSGLSREKLAPRSSLPPL